MQPLTVLDKIDLMHLHNISWTCDHRLSGNYVVNLANTLGERKDFLYFDEAISWLYDECLRIYPTFVRMVEEIENKEIATYADKLREVLALQLRDKT